MLTRSLRMVLTAIVSIVLVAGALAATSGPSNADPDGPDGPDGPDDRSISGAVTDASGSPLAGVFVTQYSCNQYVCSPYGGVFTDQGGKYSLPVTLEHVVVGFAAEHYVGEYYDNVTDHRQARTFTLGHGDHVNGINGALDQAQIVPVVSGLPVGIRVSGSGLHKQLTVPAGTWHVDNGRAPASPFTMSYQWYHADDYRPGTPMTAIAGATSSTYTTGEGDVGRYVTVVVTASAPGLRSGSREERNFRFVRDSVMTLSAARSPQRRTVEIKVRVAAAGLPFASGWVQAFCSDKRRGGSASPKVQLTQGRATIRYKPKGFTKKTKKAYCTLHYPGSTTTNNTYYPDIIRNKTIPIKLKVTKKDRRKR